MPKNKLFPGKTIGAILIISAIASLAYTFSRRMVTPAPVGINEIASNGTISLYASPTSFLIRPNVEQTMAISYDAGNDKITAVQLALAYDPTKLTLSNFINSADMPTVFKTAVITNGTIEAAYGVALDSGGKAAGGPAAWFKVKGLQPGSTTISFGENTLAYSFNLDSNALGAVHNSTITILNPGDINGDKVVNLLDFNKLIIDYGKTGNLGFSLSDLIADGRINLLDFNNLIVNYGKTY